MFDKCEGEIPTLVRIQYPQHTIMNIFCLDSDPVIAAQLMCDAHTNKMIVESAQMLANCFKLTTLSGVEVPRTQKGTARKHSYYNHPCSIWVRESLENYQWLVDHASSLIYERTFRNPTCNPHFTEGFIDWCDGAIPDNMNTSNYELTPFAIAISDDSACRAKVNNFNTLDTVSKYRQYYKYDKPFAKWTNRKVPDFMQ